ncbi:MAG TPA: class I SAM-dependent methyltransferase, partial [Candidatus Nanoarchaeia archaeon]|nr:class I SAM-dependent methyltransferase [Candidatus Nanoarchaeia archaeon]
VAIDISRKIIEVAKRISSNTLYIEDDFLNHDFGNLTFDGIFSKAFVHLFPKTDAVKVLRKMRNLISERGIVFIGTTIHDFSEEGYTEKSDYDNTVRFRRKWTRDELFDAVLNEEFKIFSEQENFESGKHWYGLILEK